VSVPYIEALVTLSSLMFELIDVKDESANKLTTSKLITYNNIMPTKIYDKIKVIGISMPPDLQRWCPNL